jgi:lipoate-protein ligase A
MCWGGKDECCLFNLQTPCIDRLHFVFVLVSQYVSGSAYKIVNKRAYHHGTMLISSNLKMLGDLLSTDKVRSFSICT